MKIYLVGGAVRDQLLGYPVRERDWVITGGTPELLLKHGYKQVGQDFPVFLHPETQEEYALARIERQSGRGYRGFKFNFDPSVTLEEDLQRRDLTINAMAIDSEGQIIDPYRGQKDLKLKLLRHVSPSFIEDPVRILRVARFAARYAHLGFKLANETRLLMYEMLRNGEITHLVSERVWQEWQRSLEEKNPEEFISVLRSCSVFGAIFPEINNLFGIPNRPEYFSGIDSGIYNLSCLKEATKLSADPVVRFGALGLEIGKGGTPIEEWPDHSNYFKLGEAKIESIASRLKVPTKYCKLAIMASLYHQQIHTLCNNDPNLIIQTLEQIDAFRRPEQFEKLLLVCEAGAKALGEQKYDQAMKWRLLLAVASKVSSQEIIAQGYKGKAIRDALCEKRKETIKPLLET